MSKVRKACIALALSIATALVAGGFRGKISTLEQEALADGVAFGHSEYTWANGDGSVTLPGASLVVQRLVDGERKMYRQFAARVPAEDEDGD